MNAANADILRSATRNSGANVLPVKIHICSQVSVQVSHMQKE